MTGRTNLFTYANVASTLALVVALSGGVAIAAGKIDGHQIKKGSISGKQIKNGAVARKELAPNALSGIDAASVDGKSAGCSAGAVEYDGACWDANVSNAAWTQAATTCSVRGGELPSIANLTTFAQARNITLVAEWSDDLSYDSGMGQVRTFKVTSPFTIENATFSELHNYRCVLPLLHP
jgi:hypothetical protein